MVLAKDDVVATEHPLASQAALRAVQSGGNAFDAAAAASFVLSVVQPHLSGLGGDFFALFYEGATGRVRCLNGSGWSPSSASVEALATITGSRVIPRFGRESVVVPGYVGGICDMHERYGKLSRGAVMSRAIDLAEHGFPVGQGLVDALGRLGGELPEAARRSFTAPSGTALRVGDLLPQRELASVLGDISESGPVGFYRGEAADAMREELSRDGYEFTSDDFSSYSPEWCEPLRMDYHGTEVYEVPPNSMGATALHMLRQIEGADPGGIGHASGERVKLMVEAAKVAYAARDGQVGDPRFSPFDLGRFLESGDAARSAQRRIDKADTTYFAIADREGNVLSCIQSIFYNFGSRVFIEKGGFFMNNRGSAFVGSAGPNQLGPRKRPLHTLSALILARAGRPYAAVGASGGDFRPQQHALFATNIIDYGMPMERAIDHPRFLWDGEEVDVESGFHGLSSLKLRVREVAYPGRTGVAQGVEVLPQALKGACDVRGEGLPAGE